jgi:hypothetical protein
MTEPNGRARAAGAHASEQEVKHLYFFHDGAIQNPYIRAQLHRHWGFCARHAWLHAIVEYELRHWIYTTAILYQDLVTRAADVLDNTRVPDALRRRQLVSRGVCLVCDHLKYAPSDPNFIEMAHWINRWEQITPRVLSIREQWQSRSCPRCLGGFGPLCRPHLLEAGTANTHLFAAPLRDLSGALSRLVKSMTYRGEPVGLADQAAWLEAVAWFSGWSLPGEIAGIASLETDLW